MSTFNGQRYVTEQLQSILSQLPAGGSILVRDDGSTDATVATIQALSEPRITITGGPNVGFGRSFLTLLSAVPCDADMVMFADQDDVWLPEKIERAWQQLKPFGSQAALYGSAQMLVDSELRPLHPTPSWPRGPSFAGALTENLITGCTAAINRPALELMQRAGVPTGVHFHDWWLYLVVSAFGRVVFDEEPTLLYRQHSGNQIGHGVGWLGRYSGIARFLLRRDWVGILLAQVNALMLHYGNCMDPAASDLVLRHYRLVGDTAIPRWRLIFGCRHWRQGWVSELMFRVLLILWRFHLWPLPGRRL